MLLQSYHHYIFLRIKCGCQQVLFLFFHLSPNFQSTSRTNSFSIKYSCTKSKNNHYNSLHDKQGQHNPLLQNSNKNFRRLNLAYIWIDYSQNSSVLVIHLRSQYRAIVYNMYRTEQYHQFSFRMAVCPPFAFQLKSVIIWALDLLRSSSSLAPEFEDVRREAGLIGSY